MTTAIPTPQHPRHTRAWKNREMLIRSLRSAVLRADELAKTDLAFATIAEDARRSWMDAIDVDHKLSIIALEAYMEATAR